MNPTDPTPLPCPTPRTDAKRDECIALDNLQAYSEMARHADDLETELAQAEAEAAAMREWIQESVVVSMKFADGRVITKADLLATTAGAEMLEQLRTLENINKRACEDWADEDTAIKDECKAFGIDTEGDSYGVPTMVDCVKQLAERLRKAEALAKHFLPTTTENTKPQ